MPRDVCCGQCWKDIGSDELAWFSDAEKDLDFCSETCHLKWNSKWKNIHPDFTEELIFEWEKKGFAYGEVKKWIEKGLNLSESRLASYGRYKSFDYYSEDLDQLRTEYQNNPTWQDWTDIHKDFGKKYRYRETYQQWWEKADITKEEAKEWIEAGLWPNDLNKIKRWKRFNFSATETKAWLEVGLDEDKYEDLEFVYWLRTKHYTPKLVKNNLEQIKELTRYGFCQRCKEPKTSRNWCQPCAEKEWKQLTGQALINKFIKQQGKDREGKDELPWIPYEEFADIKHLADGGFSKIYKAEWEYENKKYEDVVLKSLNSSQNITLEFLTEIANIKLINHSYVAYCYGISQDPTTKNYLMVMEYMEKGNLREYLQNKNSRLSLENKLYKLGYTASGLNYIHEQNLVHRDFHSGNILNSFSRSRITDLGLSRPVNHQKQEGKIFGVLPYVAPEVLQGKSYTKKADIYSFGIIAYELLANAYPYPEMDNLALAVCNGYRPNIDKVPIPQLLKDLIKRCWDSNPEQRPKTEGLSKIIYNWRKEIEDKKNTPFYQQYQKKEAEYNTFSKKPYQIHTNAITTSKMIDTKTITQQLEKLKTMEYSAELAVDFTNLNLKDNQEEQTQTQIEQPPKQ